LNDGLLPIKFVGVRSFFNKLTEERINPHVYKLNKNDFPELSEDLFITGGHPLLVDNVNEDQLIGGRTVNEEKFSIVCSTFMTRRSAIQTEMRIV
jgi:hypothetical protein